MGDGFGENHLMFQEATKGYFGDQKGLEFDKFLYDNEELRQVDFEAMSMISEVSQVDFSFPGVGAEYAYDTFYV